ncbi:MAG TPA: GntR family transcriptional regulator, partial [Thiobacillaceae bacterium]
IVTLELPPGSAISEVELSARLGIGRTPVREALQRLAREHLVLVLPQRGVLVADIDIKCQLRLLEVRRSVEALIVRCAAKRAQPAERKQFAELAAAFQRAGRAGDQAGFMRADKAFNELSLRAARNEFAAASMLLMHGLSRRFWVLHDQQARDTGRTARLHGKLARAIADGHEQGSASALEELLDHNEAFTRATLNTD